jgi:hypothetical protein
VRKVIVKPILMVRASSERSSVKSRAKSSK